MKLFSIRNKLLAFSIMISMIPLLVAGQKMISIARDEIKSGVQVQINNTATVLEREITQTYASNWIAQLAYLRSALLDPLINTLSKEQLIRRGLQTMPDVVSLQISNAQGSSDALVVSPTFDQQMQLIGRDAHQVVRVNKEVLWGLAYDDDGIYLGEPFFVNGIEKWYFEIALVLQRHLGEKPSAVMVAAISLDGFQRLLISEDQYFPGNISILNKEGNLLFTTPSILNEKGKEIRRIASQVSGGSSFGVVREYETDSGQRLLVSGLEIPNFGWTLIHSISEDIAYLPIDKMYQQFTWWLSIGLFVAITMAIALAVRISRPIRQMESVAHAVSQRNLDVQVENVNSRDEIGELAKSINEMIQGLRKAMVLQKFVSGSTVQAVEMQKAEAGERHEVTMFFADIRGFTAFSQEHSPEEVVSMLNVYLSAQTEIVQKYEGDVDKFVGDELVAVFRGHQMVRNAIRCAIEIQQEMVKIQGANEWGLDIGIGINTGEVVVGSMGSRDRKDYTVLGHHVNLGARLCSAATGRQILISEHTMAKIDRRWKIECVKTAPMTLKGARSIDIYEVRY